ncbi:hypothetical protein OEZ86_013358 [Tetradesmus obliquus]|nr:hypothetical protein OEZ86_013358 [Tetradesmus obliquus]
MLLLALPSIEANDGAAAAHGKWGNRPSCVADNSCISVTPGEGVKPGGIIPIKSLGLRGHEYILQVAIKLDASSTNPNCDPYKFAELRRAAIGEAYTALKARPEAGLIRRWMADIAYTVGTPLPGDSNNPIGGSVEYYEIGVFSVYVNVPVSKAFIAEFAKTDGVKNTLECIVANKRVANAMPA